MSAEEKDTMVRLKESTVRILAARKTNPRQSYDAIVRELLLEVKAIP